MNNADKQARLQQAVDSRLSGLQEDPFLAGRIMQNEQGEIKMKKKFSASLILALSLALVCAFALAEGLNAPGSVQNTAAPAQTLAPFSRDENREETPAFLTLTAAVPVYAPVSFHCFDAETSEFDLMPMVAQINCTYRIYYTEDAGFTGCDFPEDRPITVTTLDAGQFLSEYLSAEISDAPVPSDIAFSGNTDGYTLDVRGKPFTLSYYKDLYLDQRGQIVGTEKTQIEVPLLLTDQNGTLLDQNGQPLEGGQIHAAASDQHAWSILPALSTARLPAPTMLPAASASALNEHPIASWRPLPGEEMEDSPYVYSFSLGFSVDHLVSDPSTGLPVSMESALYHTEPDGFHLVFNPDAFVRSSAYHRSDTHPLFEDDWVYINARSDAYSGAYWFDPPLPSVTVEYGSDSYTVRLSGVHLKVSYSDKVFYDPQAVQIADDGSAAYDWSVVHKTGETFFNESIDADCNFVLPYPNGMSRSD